MGMISATQTSGTPKLIEIGCKDKNKMRIEN